MAKLLTLIINQSCNWQSAHYYLVCLSLLIGQRKLAGSEENWIETKCTVNGIMLKSRLRIYWQGKLIFNPRIINHSDFTFISTDIFVSIFPPPLLLVLSGEEASRKHEPLNGKNGEQINLKYPVKYVATGSFFWVSFFSNMQWNSICEMSLNEFHALIQKHEKRYFKRVLART